MIENILNHTPREIAGPRTGNAFDYQRNWSLAKILEYHLDGRDYVFVFEFHDDILIIDSENNPQAVEFCQVKTSRKNWTLGDLINTSNKGEDKKLSILGKLYCHKCDFHGLNSKLYFITNALFNFNSSLDHFCFIDLDEKIKDKIKENINLELSGLQEEDYNSLFFERSKLGLENHQIYLKGIIQDFLVHYFGDEHSIPINPIYRLLTDEIGIKKNLQPSNYNSLNDLFRNKGISKSDIEKFVNQLKLDHHKVKPTWSLIETKLNQLDYTINEILIIKNSWDQFFLEKMDSSNDILQNLIKMIENELSHMELKSSPLDTVISKIENSISEYTSKHETIFNKYYTIAIILWKYCETTFI